MEKKPEPSQTKTKKKPHDPFKPLKYIAYCKACTPPEGMNYGEFLEVIKTYLCFETKTLFKDPIWDTYSDEELIIEYYARLFKNSPERREEFEAEIDKKDVLESEYDEFLKFADKGIEKNREELEEKADKLEDSLSFTPDTLGD